MRLRRNARWTSERHECGVFIFQCDGLLAGLEVWSAISRTLCVYVKLQPGYSEFVLLAMPPQQAPPPHTEFSRSYRRSAIKRAIRGDTRSTSTSRAVCMAMTKGTSTLVEAAMIATVSAPPGLVAR